MLGGNHGTYALYSAALNQSVLIFEVLLDYCIVTQESKRINQNFDERVILYPFDVSDEYQTFNDLTVVHTYPIDNFVFQKVSVMKIEVEGFEIRALNGALHVIRQWGVGAILIEIAAKRWNWNNITLDEGIALLEHVTSMGKYSSYIIARNDEACPMSQISKLDRIIHINYLSMINMQNGKSEVAPQIFRLTEWTTIITQMPDIDWSCNFWLESALK